MSVVLVTLSLATLILFLFKVILPVVHWFRDGFRLGKELGVFATPYPGKFHWLLGHMPYLPRDLHEGSLYHMKKEGCSRAYVVYMGSMMPLLHVCHYETIAPVVKTAEPKPTEGFTGYKLIYDWIGDGLLLSKGPKWFRNRRLLTPAFHFDILKPYVKIYNTCVEEFMGKVEQACDSGDSIEVFEYIGLYTLDVILQCAFSYSGAVQQKRNAYTDAVGEMSTLVIERAYKPWLIPNFTYYLSEEGRRFKKNCEISHMTAKEVISKRRETLGSGVDVGEVFKTRKYVDFLDVLLLARDTDGSPLSDREIRDEVETFMFEGHDTTKSAISFILYNLARHPEIQQRARAEVQTLLVGRNSHDITWEDLANMPYITQCIKESLRLHPPVYEVDRLLTQPLKLDGKIAPVGTQVAISIYPLHHHPEIWGEDHMTYDPERFNEDNMRKMDPYAFLPFSAGPRNCIGQTFALHEIKTLVARVLHRFELTVDQSVPFLLSMGVVLKTKNGIHLHFKKL